MKIHYFFLFACSFLIVQSVNGQNVKKGLIAQYLFNNDVKDNSGNNNHGVMKGGLQFDEDRFGARCGALKFNGSDSYVEVPSSSSLESPTNELTVAVWFKLDAGATDLKWLTVCCKSNLSIETDDSPQYRMQATRVTLSVNTEFTENLNKDIDIGRWYHYTMVYDGSYVTAYLDGFSFFTFPYSGVFTANQMPLDIGRDIPGVLEFYSGSFDDLRIYDRALKQREVQAIYNDDSERTSPKPCPAIIPPTTSPTPTTPPETPPTPTPTPTPTPLPFAPPVVTITDPSTSPYEVNTADYTIIATIENISSSNDITFFVNGIPNTNFAFDSQTQEFISTIQLVKGRNICEIIATNTDGKDNDTAILDYMPTLNPPLITIIIPVQNPYQAPQNTQQIIATITNINSERDIEFKLNGISDRGFTFDPVSKTFTVDVNLEEGSNHFEITATNLDGQDQKSGIIRYASAVRQPPVITVLNPPESPHSTNQQQFQIRARIEHISGSQDITFRFNGVPSSSFSFDASSEQFSANVSLMNGNNIFEILASNKDGKDSKSGIIQYTINSQPPIVTITLPTANPHEVTHPRQRIQAKIEYVNGKEDIQFRFNGKTIDAFTFDSGTLAFESDRPLEQGYNAFEIKATNPDGSDTKTGSIIYRPAVSIPPPDPGDVTITDDIEVSSPTVKLFCYDHKEIDGDIVSVLLNGEVLINKKELRGRVDGEMIIELPPLELNKSYIVISKAWNLGRIPPNTMTIEIYDDGKLLKTVVLESEIGKSEAIRLIYRGQ